MHSCSTSRSPFRSSCSILETILSGLSDVENPIGMAWNDLECWLAFFRVSYLKGSTPLELIFRVQIGAN